MRARETRTGGQFLARERGSEEHSEEIHEVPPVPSFPLADRIKPEQLEAFLIWCGERKLREVA